MNRTLGLAGLAGLLLLAPLAPALANGGTVRISRAPVGRYLVSVFSSPTPLRTGEVDISVLVQDSGDAVVRDVAVRVEARPIRVSEGGVSAVRETATREAATNKLFQAAKFPVETPGEWEFRIEVGGDEGAGGAVSFRAELTEATLLDRPYLLATLVLLPVLLVAWLVRRRGGDDGPQSRIAAMM